jgi:hypothetical protein
VAKNVCAGEQTSYRVYVICGAIALSHAVYSQRDGSSENTDSSAAARSQSCDRNLNVKCLHAANFGGDSSRFLLRNCGDILSIDPDKVVSNSDF